MTMGDSDPLEDDFIDKTREDGYGRGAAMGGRRCGHRSRSGLSPATGPDATTPASRTRSR